MMLHRFEYETTQQLLQRPDGDETQHTAAGTQQQCQCLHQPKCPGASGSMTLDPHWEEAVSLLLLNEQRQCSLLGNTFGYVIQTVLGVLAFLALVAKRYQEPEKMRRTWGIWAADSSKQAIGAFVAHGANMLISYGWASGAQDNECLFYLVNFVADCVVGLAFNIILLKASVHVAEKYFNSDVLTSGEYGNPFEWSRWLAQLSAWLMVTLIAKALLVFAVVLPFKDPLYRLVDVIFRPLNKYPQLELVLIMVVIPLVLNALTFWIQDHFLMKPLEDSTGVWAKDNFDDVDEDILAAIARLEYGDVADDHVDQSTREALVNPQSRGFRLFADGANSYS